MLLNILTLPLVPVSPICCAVNGGFIVSLF